MFYPRGAFSLDSALSWAIRSHGTKDQTDWHSANEVKQAATGFPLLDADRRATGIPHVIASCIHPLADCAEEAAFTSVLPLDSASSLGIPVVEADVTICKPSICTLAETENPASV